MAASSSGSWRYDVFPSFSGEDVRKTFLSHLLKELDRKSINTFIDHGIERSRPIAPELLSAIRESRIAIVIFSKNYASSTWCLNELVKIHECYEKFNQMVIPVFYDVDPSEVRKQTGEFGKVFEETCKNDTEDKQQGWVRALSEIATIAGEHLQNWSDEASMIEKIVNDVSNKLVTTSNDFRNFVGIEAHLEALRSLLCLESEEAKMVGIVGTSGIGKSTIGGALFSNLSIQYPMRAFGTYRRTIQDDYRMKLSWEKQFLSEILDQKDIKIDHVGEVKQRLKHKKVLIVLDDVDELKLLETLVGKTEWFGPGSRIIVITQDRQLLRAHKIDVIYEVEFPSKDLALKMLCRSAFEQDSPPDGFMELAVEVAKLAGNLPLGLSVLGSSLKERDKDEWMEMMPRLRNDLDGNIEKTLRVSYDRLNKKDRELFLCIACFFNGFGVSYGEDLFVEDKVGLKTLIDKSLIRITPIETIEMHSLLVKLGREIDREESNGNPGKRRFLDDFEYIREVFMDKTGTETVLGIRLDTYLSIDENSFKGMRNLQYLIVWPVMDQPQSLDYLPRKLRLLHWLYCPLKCLPSNFKAEYLVELNMKDSMLEKLWEGTQPLGSLKKMVMSWSIFLKEIPDLSKAINLEELNLYCCESLVTLPFSIKNATKLKMLNMNGCTNLESFPTDLNLESLEYLNLQNCPNFPKIKMRNSTSWPHGIKIKVGDCLWNKNLPGPDYLDCLMRCMRCKFRPEYLVRLIVRGNKTLEKLWEGVQSLSSLVKMDLSECENLREIPDLSKATNLESLTLNNCYSLVTVPSTIGNLHKLVKLEMIDCTRLEVLPTDVNLSSLKILDLSSCSSLRSFPHISWSIERLNLEYTAIEEVPCCIENFSRLTILMMFCCERLKNISPNIFRLTRLGRADFSGSGGVITALNDASFVATMEDHFSCIPLYENIEYGRVHSWEDKDDSNSEDSDSDDSDSEDSDFIGAYFSFLNCFKLDRDARELIIRSCFKPVALPGGEVPTYFQHRKFGDSLTVTLPQSSFSQKIFRFKACIVVDLLTEGEWLPSYLKVRVGFNGIEYYGTLFEDAEDAEFEDAEMQLCETDLLILCYFKFQPTDLPSKLASNDVKFKFSHVKKIKECGVQLLKIKDDSGGSSETEPPNDSDGSKKRMRMTSGASEEYIVVDTGLDALNLELSLGQGEASSVSSYPCLEGEAFSIITEQQDEVIPILYPTRPGNCFGCSFLGSTCPDCSVLGSTWE